MLWEPPQTMEELMEFSQAALKAWELGQAYSWTVESRDSQVFLGKISIRKDAEEYVWNIGFWLHPEQQGKGYMTEAVEALLAFGFNILHAKRIEACCALWNIKSENVLKRVVMKFRKYITKGFKKRGKWVEENLYAITQEEWTDRKNISEYQASLYMLSTIAI